jgi:hypothetical protein
MMLEQTIAMLCMIQLQTSEKDRQDIPLLPVCTTTQNFLCNERERAEANRKRDAFQDNCGCVVLEGFLIKVRRIYG